MQTKKLIINADDFGMSKAANTAILSSFCQGILTSASITSNGEAFYDAQRNVIPKCEGLGIGVHLNIVEGKALLQSKILCAENGYFQLSFGQILKSSSNKYFLNEIEKEFRAQIEKAMDFNKIDHLDSHMHIHAIPSIFKLVCKLAREYQIQYIRTQYEQFTPVLTSNKTYSKTFAINMIKVMLLNAFTIINKPTVHRYGLRTNDLLIGVQYTGFMDAKIIKNKLSHIKSQNCIVETNLHPSWFEQNQIEDKTRYVEYLTITDEALKIAINDMGFNLTSYGQLGTLL